VGLSFGRWNKSLLSHMKKILCLFLSLLCFEAIGQSVERLWEEGELSWDDFKGEPFEESPNSSELNYNLSYITTKKKVGDTTLFMFETRNYMNPGISWVKESDKSEQLLKYNQVLFDILEVHRRKLQSTLHRLDNIYRAEDKFRTEFEYCNQELRRFRKETKQGADLAVLDYWEKRISTELGDNPFELIPEYDEGWFGYGMNAGFGAGLLTESIGEHFTPTFDFTYGFDFAIKNTVLNLNAVLAGNRVKLDYREDDRLWPKDLKTNVAIIDLSIGQTIFNNAKHKITPFAGFGIMEFSVAEKEGEEYQDQRIVNYGVIYGLYYDLKFKKSIRITPSPFGGRYREAVDQSIRVKLFAKFASVTLSPSIVTFSYRQQNLHYLY
jgi:hypothetical protein